MKNGLRKAVGVLLAVAIGCTVGACREKPSSTPEKEDQMIKELNRLPILTNRDKIVLSPTFALDESVPESRDIRLPLQFADYMVLQANAVNCVFGTCATDGEIAAVVRGNGYDKTFYGTVTDGKFEVYLDTVPYGTGYTLCLYTSAGRKTFADVAFGEVYLMSGQSNMGMTMGQCLNPYSESGECVYQDILDGYSNENVRVMGVTPNVSLTEIDSLPASAGLLWRVVDKKSAENMSAVAFFFSNRMYERYKVPIGIIQSAMGGTVTCTWVPLAENERTDKTYANREQNPTVTNADTNTPATRFNAMIYPLRKTTVRGVCWYQGEGQNIKYFENTSLLISGWRRTFGRDDLPFHIVELPRYMAGDHDGWFSVRSQQRRLAVEGTNVSYSVNIDCGIFPRNTAAGIYNPGILSADGIHPSDKKPVGMRSADAFAKRFYGATGTLAGPVLQSVTLTADGCIVAYDTEGGVLELSKKACGFEVSADGTSWTYARPEIYSNNEIRLTYTLATTPAYVRYGYAYGSVEVFGGMGAPDTIADLVCVYNDAGYPADQFSTAVTRWA